MQKKVGGIGVDRKYNLEKSQYKSNQSQGKVAAAEHDYTEKSVLIQINVMYRI